VARALPLKGRIDGWLLGGPLPRNREFAVHKIIKANIERFKLLLLTETDQTKRAMEIRLLAEEEAKLTPIPEKKEA
jgi:hypothetical protein